MKEKLNLCHPIPFVRAHATALALFAAIATLLPNTGCLVLRTSSYADGGKSRKETQQTNFLLEEVKTNGLGSDDNSLKEKIEALDSKQDKRLVAVPYRVDMSWDRNDDIYNNTLFFLTLGIVPSWDVVKWQTKTTVSMPGDEFVVNGENNRIQMNGWLFLPFQLLAFQFENYDDNMNTLHWMVDNDRVNRRIAKAIDSHLTKARYDAAIEAMSKDARKKLADGKTLSESDLRLLEEGRYKNDAKYYADWAKHPDNVLKSREALAKIQSSDELADIALRAGIPEIRKSAAEKITSLPESRFADLARKSTDRTVANVFLGKVSDNRALAVIVKSPSALPELKKAALTKIFDNELLAGIVESPSALLEIRDAALAKIGDEATLQRIAMAGDVKLDLKLAAVERIDGEQFLGGLIANAPDREVRAAAIAKTWNDDILLPAVLGDSSADNRLAAVKHISGTNVLDVILRKSGDETVRSEALSGMTDLGVLKRTVASDSSIAIRKAALERIRDDGVVAEIAHDNDSAEIRNVAILRTDDEAVLVRLAEDEWDEDNLLAILRKIGNQEVLSRMAENAESAKVRGYAVGRLPEGDVVARVAENDPDNSVREIALAKVSDQEVLTRIAKSDFDPKLRIKALERVSDTEVLKSIVENDSDLDVCLAALAKIDDPAFLAHVAKEDGDEALRLAAVKRVSDEEVLKSVALTDGDPQVRLEALSKIDDEETIGKVAKGDANANIRKQAVEKIKDQRVLADVARSDNDEHVRFAAVSQLRDQEILLSVIACEKDVEARKAAFRNLSAKSKTKLAKTIEVKAKRNGGVSLRGFYLGMEETDAALLTEVLLPSKSLSSFATISAGRVSKFTFSSDILASLLSETFISIDDLPSSLQSALGCRFRYNPKTLSKDGTEFAKQDIYTCSTIGGETMMLYVSQWEEIPSGVQYLVRMAQFDAPYDDPGFFVLGYKAALAKLLDDAKLEGNPKPGTLIWK